MARSADMRTDLGGNAAQPASGRELYIARILDAPRELVFDAWIDPHHARRWWCPHGFTVTQLDMDARPGGAWKKCMRSAEGKEYWRSGTFREVVRPERLVFTYISDDPHSEPGHEAMVTIRFTDLGGSTRMEFHQGPFTSPAERDSHRHGWSEALERLAAHLAPPGLQPDVP